jgi:hypothetical protein
MLTVAIGLIAALVTVLVTANIVGILAQLRRENKELRERLWMYRYASYHPDVVEFRYNGHSFLKDAATGRWTCVGRKPCGKCDNRDEEIDCDLSDLDGVNSPS